jgi:hypothetical protein
LRRRGRIRPPKAAILRGDDRSAFVLWGIKLRLLILLLVLSGVIAFVASFTIVMSQNPNPSDSPLYGNVPSVEVSLTP